MSAGAFFEFACPGCGSDRLLVEAQSTHSRTGPTTERSAALRCRKCGTQYVLAMVLHKPSDQHVCTDSCHSHAAYTAQMREQGWACISARAASSEYKLSRRSTVLSTT